MSNEKCSYSLKNYLESPHELGFRIFHGQVCGFPSCNRSSTHYHCKHCGFGTSQICNATIHKRSCAGESDYPQLRDCKMQTTMVGDPFLQHDPFLRSSQGYPFYTTSAPISVSSSSNSQVTNSKLLPVQQSTMFNFILPGQNPQYNTIYSGQNVFPNPNMFSPSGFNNFDPWLSQSRILTPNNPPSLPDLISNTRLSEKIDISESPSCCRLESTSVGMCSPLTAETYKMVSKELSKIENQNWFCNTQSTISFNSQSSCKLTENFQSCLPQISYSYLEQPELRQVNECIDVEDLCFEQSQKSNVKEIDREYSSCGEIIPDVNSGKEKIKKLEVKEKHKMEDFVEKNLETEEKVDLESMDCTESNSTCESDIVVEASDKEQNSSEEEESVPSSKTCVVCHDSKTNITELTEINHKESSILNSNRPTSIFSKLSQIIDHSFNKLKSGSVCNRCLHLVNLIDSLEIKLTSARNELKSIMKNVKKYQKETDEKRASNSVLKIKNEVSLVIKETNENLNCEICNKKFSSLHYLEKHKQYHTKSFSFYCDRCGLGFTLLKKLENHILLHLESSRFQCEVCGKRFIQKHYFDDHLKKHNQQFQYSCIDCLKGFNRKRDYHLHTQTHLKEKNYICHICGKQFTAESNLKTHIQICSKLKQFKCIKCSKDFTLKSLLEKHILMKHENKPKFKCNIEVCTFGCMKESDLKRHMLSHSAKTFKCEKCNKLYKTVSSLNHHAKIHNGSSELKCDICQKQFTRKSVLEDHKNIHLKKKPYSCTKCNKCFSNKLNLHTHIKRHDGKLGKYCPICNKFLANGVKKEHLKSHSGDKPFKCDKCNLFLSTKRSLIKHNQRKHDIT